MRGTDGQRDLSLLVHLLNNHSGPKRDSQIATAIASRNEDVTLCGRAPTHGGILCEVHYYMQGETQPLFTLEDLGDMYRGVARAAHVFVSELAGRDIRTCWLQDMNVERLKRRFRGRSLKRIDLSIGVKDRWGRGIGARVIRLLTRFGLDRLGADAIFAVEIYDLNARSLGAFQNAGFRLFEVVPTASPGRARPADHILVVNREGFTAR